MYIGFKEGGGTHSYRLTEYQPYTFARVAVVVAVVAAILVPLGCTGNLPTITFAEHTWKIVTGVSVPLICGTALILFKVHHSGLSQGKIWGTSHWKKVFDCYIDFSYVDEKGTGIARLYAKSQFAASATAFGLALITPLYAALTIVYHTLRMVIVPFYILVRLYQERNGRVVYPQEGKFAFFHIPKEMGKSLLVILKTPFYATALFYTALKALFDPCNGIKEGSAVEYDWNDGVPLFDKGIWLMRFNPEKGYKWEGIQSAWKWEGGGGPQNLGCNGFYAAGSWLPQYEYHLRAGIVISSTEKDIRPLCHSQGHALPAPSRN